MAHNRAASATIRLCDSNYDLSRWKQVLTKDDNLRDSVSRRHEEINTDEGVRARCRANGDLPRK